MYEIKNSINYNDFIHSFCDVEKYGNFRISEIRNCKM